MTISDKQDALAPTEGEPEIVVASPAPVVHVQPMPTPTVVNQQQNTTVEVIAPTDLNAGYRFNCDVGGGKMMLVEVVSLFWF